jgi:hypothetical protein
MSRIFLLACCLLLTACASVKNNEFNAVDPEEVVVVLGYQVAGSPSVSPKLASAAYIAGLLTPGVGGLAVMIGSMYVNDIFRTDDAITMIDEFNDDVYKSVEAALTAKGYKVRLLKKMPIALGDWKPNKLSNSYLSYIEQTYQLSESELTMSDADVVLYLEYRIDANIKDMAELTSMHATDLKVDQILRNVQAFSMPPRNRPMYKHSIGYKPLWNRLPYGDTIKLVTGLEQWPERDG